MNLYDINGYTCTTLESESTNTWTLVLKLAYGQHPALLSVGSLIMDSEVLYLFPLQWDHFILRIWLIFFSKDQIWLILTTALARHVPLPLPSCSYHHCETNQNHICPKPLMALTILTQQFSLLLKPKICPAKLFEVYCNWKFILLVEGFHHFKFGLPFSSTI